MPILRVVLDECLDRRLARAILNHDVRTVPEMGWAGLKNGELLTRAQSEFDVFITGDRNLAFQQNIGSFDIAVIVLQGRTNRLSDLMPLIPRIFSALQAPKKGRLTLISQ